MSILSRVVVLSGIGNAINDIYMNDNVLYHSQNSVKHTIISAKVRKLKFLAMVHQRSRNSWLVLR